MIQCLQALCSQSERQGPMIKTLIFDVYDTIIQVKSGGSAEIVRAHLLEHGFETDKEEFHALWGRYYRAAELEEGFRFEQQMFRDRIGWLFGHYGCMADPAPAYDDTLAEALKRIPYPESRAAIDALRKKYRVVIGSNTDDFLMYHHLAKDGIEADAYYTSESLKCYKPKPQFYHAILKAEGIEPSEAVFIGDSLNEDVKTPLALGMHAIWVNRKKPHQDIGQDATVNDLMQLESVLDGLA